MELQRHKIPVIALWDSSPELDNMGDYIFGIGPWTPSSGEVAAKFGLTKLKAKSAVVINSIDPWASLVSDYFEATFKKQGGKILKRYEVNPDTSDFKSILINAKNLNPDLVFSPIIDHIPTFYQQKMAVRFNTPCISADIIAKEHIDKAPKALVGVYQTRNKEPMELESQKIFRIYENKFGRKLTMSWFVTTAYDAIMIYAEALRSGSLSGEKIKDYLYTIKNFSGLTQNFSFTKAGSAPQMAVIYQVQKGDFEFIWEPDHWLS